jgi:hypothetical protein
VSEFQKQIRDFLSTDTPDVLCIKGRWGVGKTFIWNHLLEEAAGASQIKLKKYGYVSLFGVNSLEALRNAVFQNVAPISVIGKPYSIDSVVAEKAGFAEKFARTIAEGTANLLDFGREAGVLSSLAFMSVRENIICIDDLERRGRVLSIADVMGTLATLRDQQKCKCVLITNNDTLEDGDADIFDRLYEKVVDISLTYDPTPRTVLDIVYPKAPVDALKPVQIVEPAFVGLNRAAQRQLRACALKLNITNFRLLKKMARLYAKLEPHLTWKDGEVAMSAINTLVFLCYCYYGEDSPDIEYVFGQAGRGTFAQYWDAASGKDERTDEQKRWSEVMTEYGFGYMDEIDDAVWQGIQAGYFHELTWKEIDLKFKDIVSKNARRQEFHNAWSMFHNGIEDDHDAVVDALESAFCRATDCVSLSDLDGTYRLFEELGKSDRAQRLIDAFVNEPFNQIDAFDEASNAVLGAPQSEAVRTAVRRRYDELLEKVDITTAFRKISRNEGCSRAELRVLSEVSEDEIHNAIQKCAPEHRQELIKGLLLFRGHGTSSDDPHRKIGQRCESLLRRLASESLINRLRMKKYGIDLDKEDAENSEPNGP